MSAVRDKRYLHQYLAGKYIESRAMKLLVSYEDRYGKLTGPPVPIHHLAESHLELYIDWDDVYEPEGVTNLACIDPEKRKIYMNQSHRDFFEEYFGSEEFSLAHEVGHWDLHVFHNGWVQLSLFDADDNRFMCRTKRNEKDEKERVEIQADIFAAALLMPYNMVINEIQGKTLTQWSTLYRLRDNFGVSISAMVNRLKGMGLLRVADDGSLTNPSHGEAGQLSF